MLNLCMDKKLSSIFTDLNHSDLDMCTGYISMVLYFLPYNNQVCFLASIQVFPTKVLDVDVMLDGSVKLKWQFTVRTGETFATATIKLVQPGKSEINVALFQSEFKILTYPDYSKRGWSVTHATGSFEIVLEIKNAQEADDGVYNLEMHYVSSSTTVSDKKGIRLNVLGKIKTFLHSMKILP